MQDFFFQDTLNTEKRILNFAGIYPEIHTKRMYFKSVRKFICVLLSCLLEISLLTLIVINVRDLGTVMGALMLLLQQTAFISKLSIFIFKGDQLQMLEMKLKQFASHQLLFSDTMLLKNNLQNISKIGQIYRLSCILCCTFFGAGPFMNGGTKFELPMPGYLPYEISNQIKYFATYFYQMASLYIAACLNSSVDILNCRLITIATTLFEILIKRLKNIGHEDVENHQEEFIKCIYFHNKLLEFIRGIEDLYSYIVFSQFAASVVVICSTAFELVILPVGSGEFVGSLMYLINMIIEVALYCWYGHNIQTMSESLGTACYISRWYETDTKTKKMITIFMEQSKRSVTLTAAKLFPLSLTTLTMILRSSYSYFAVLQRVYSDK
nr:odorant receptor 13 [Pachyrhinus yasumatsui]